MNAIQAIQRAARENGIRDWRALAAVGNAESSLNPGNIGDSGSSYGLFQLHRGGALGNMSDSQARKYLDAYQNASFAARKIKALGIHNLTGRDAIDAIVRRFEIPANPSAEVERAWQWYQSQGKGLAQPKATATTFASPTLTQGSGGAGGQSTAPMQALLDRNAKAFHLPTIHLPPTTPANVSFNLAPDHGVDVQSVPAANDLGSAITQAAKHFLGVRYVWGGASPKGFDCSGLVKYVFAKFGITTPRVSQDQFKGGQAVNAGQSRPGDLIFFRHADGSVGHVGIVLGGGKFLHAPHTGDVVKISNLKGYGLPVAGIRRYAA